MIFNCVWEHNGDDSLMYVSELPGAYTRGTSREIALEKMPIEISAYFKWCSRPMPTSIEVVISQETQSNLQICDADSDVILESEKTQLTMIEYIQLKQLVLKSAEDFQLLYDSIPDKFLSVLPERRTFYGTVPRTAREMYEHTKNVNAYYFGEIGVDADNSGTILECRERGFAVLEGKDNFLDNGVVIGSYGESRSLRKVIRRFIWHDRIHAKAMYRMAQKTFGYDHVRNVFGFE